MTRKNLAAALFAAHERQIIRKGARPGNLGWVVTEKSYLSKTNKGILDTTRQPNGRYRHVWLNADGEAILPPDAPWDYRPELKATLAKLAKESK